MDANFAIQEVLDALIWDKDRFMICQHPRYKGSRLSMGVRLW